MLIEIKNFLIPNLQLHRIGMQDTTREQGKPQTRSGVFVETYGFVGWIATTVVFGLFLCQTAC